MADEMMTDADTSHNPSLEPHKENSTVHEEQALPAPRVSPSIAPSDHLQTRSPDTPLTVSKDKPDNLSATVGMQADIARILDEAKLPERRDVHDTINEPRRPPPVPPQPTPDPVLSHEGEKEEKPRGPVVPIRTFRQDLQDVVKDTQLSLVEAAALEEDKRAHREHEPEAHRSPFLERYGRPLLIACAFFALGGLALGAVFLIVTEQKQGASTHFDTSLLFSEQIESFPLSNNPGDNKRSLAAARSLGGLTIGSILRLVPTVSSTDPQTLKEIEREATAVEFLEAIEARVPDELVRTLGNDFFFGLHIVDEHAPVLVFEVGSYERAFAGMLQWEKTMNADLSPIFSPLSPLIKNAEGLVVERAFTDTVMQNYDVRALKDDTGTIQLYYSFPSRSILIIAESQYSFPEILNRLRAERKL